MEELERLRVAASAKWGRAVDIAPLQSGLAMSGRRYYLITLPRGVAGPAERVVAAVAPALKSWTFIRIRELLASNGIPTPTVYDRLDWGENWVVLQEYLAGPTLVDLQEKQPYLETLVGLVHRLTRIEIPVWASEDDLRRRYDGAYIQSRMASLVQPAFAVALRRPLTATEVTTISGGLSALAAVADAQPFAFAHRDLQSSNVIVCNGTPHLIDFQSASLAPVGFDLACLLYDSYTAYPTEVRRHLTERYSAFAGTTLDTEVLTGLAAYRKLFDLANFVQAVVEMGISGYKTHLSRTAAMAVNLWSEALGVDVGQRLRPILTEVVEHAADR
jgi:aminoglycoside/choline kinase family phosphotransferase